MQGRGYNVCKLYRGGGTIFVNHTVQGVQCLQALHGTGGYFCKPIEILVVSKYCKILHLLFSQYNILYCENNKWRFLLHWDTNDQHSKLNASQK